MNLNKLLQLLSDGEYHSGEALGQAMGVSRAAVWKQLASLEPLGLALESRHRTGYRIAGGLDLLHANTIHKHLQQKALVDKLDILLTVDSTNARALAAPIAPARAYICLAESQQAGRGRHGRDWVSPFANSVYLSLAWEFTGGAAALEGLSLAVGVAVVKALEESGIHGTRLKWPNDIVFDGSKLGGILVEFTGELSGPCKAVIGVGINGAMPQRSGAGIDIPYTDLKTLAHGQMPDRNRLIAALVDQLLALVSSYEHPDDPHQGFARWRKAWQTLDSLMGQNVRIHLGNRRMEGIAAGIDQRGALRLKTSAGIQTFASGEVSLKPR